METAKSTEIQSHSAHWLSRNVFAMGLTSFLSDFCHEMATAVLPQFMQTIGASAGMLEFIGGGAVRRSHVGGIQEAG